MHNLSAWFGRFIAVATCAGVVVTAQVVRHKIDRAEQLPTHTYPVPGSVSKILTDDPAFTALSRSVRRDMEADLRDYDIADRSTLRDYYGTLLEIAIIERRPADANRLVALVREAQEKEAAKLESGLFERALIAARTVGPDKYLSTFSSTFSRELAALPYEKVEAELKAQKAGIESLSANLYLGVAEEQLDPAAKSGTISLNQARTAIEIKFILVEMLPVKEVAVQRLTNVIASHRRVKADIWASREVSLEGTAGLEPVVVAIWDTGLDTSLFPGRVWRDEKGDSGIGWTWDGEPSSGPLRPVLITAEQLNEGKRFTKGFSDMQAGVDSPDASAARGHLASLTKERVKPFLESTSFYGIYAHGTHVAGIAARGNPAIRLLAARIEFPYLMVPPAPTGQWARGQARIMTESVAYFGANHVRVVNMSWGNSPGEIEGNLEANAQGGSPQDRRALAHRYFETIKDAFRDAIAGSPDILFVCAAGNSNSNPDFDERIPSSFDLPNLITVGAVDQAGDETGFTNLGNVPLYASGYEVESVLPGGEKQRLSGTSMASPQVVNLAAKLLAKYPALITADLRELILDGADTRTVGGNRKIRLLNEKRSFELAASRPVRRGKPRSQEQQR